MKDGYERIRNMTINEAAHYWHVGMYNPDNLIRVQCNDEGLFEYWNAETGEVVRAKDLNR